MSAGKSRKIWAAALFATVWTVYVWTSAPSYAWLDSPEITAASVELGVMHSPGHPMVAMLGKLASFVPVGSVPWRLNLMSALMAALATVFLMSAIRFFLQQHCSRLGAGTRDAMASFGAAVFGFSTAVWSNAIRAEVYALEALLLAFALAELMRSRSDGAPFRLRLAALATGAAFVNHYVIGFAFAAPLLGWLWLVPRVRRRTWGWLCGFAALPLFAIAYLPVRAATNPVSNWGVPSSLDRLLWTLSGRAFSKNVNGEHASSLDVDFFQGAFATIESLSISLSLLALAGVLLLWSSRGDSRKTGVVLALIAAISIGLRALLGFDPETPDHHAYLLPAVLVGVILGVYGLAKIAESIAYSEVRRPSAGPIAAVGLGALALVHFATGVSAHARMGNWAPDDVAHWELQDVPPGALVLPGYFQTSFRQQALIAVEEIRPDLVWLDRSFLTYPGHAAAAKHRYPEFGELIDAPVAAGYPTPISLLTEIAKLRPVMMQLHLNVDKSAHENLASAGAFARWDRRDEAVAARDIAASQDLRRLLATAKDDSARAALLWHETMRLDHFCTVGAVDSAKDVYRDIIKLIPEDETLQELASACGL